MATKVAGPGATVAIYARISEDRADGAGVDRQLADCRALVKRNGWGKAQEYTDNNISAFSGKVRPAYAQMLEAIRAGIIGSRENWKCWSSWQTRANCRWSRARAT